MRSGHKTQDTQRRTDAPVWRADARCAACWPETRVSREVHFPAVARDSRCCVGGGGGGFWLWAGAGLHPQGRWPAAPLSSLAGGSHARTTCSFKRTVRGLFDGGAGSRGHSQCGASLRLRGAPTPGLPHVRESGLSHAAPCTQGHSCLGGSGGWCFSPRLQSSAVLGTRCACLFVRRGLGLPAGLGRRRCCEHCCEHPGTGVLAGGRLGWGPAAGGALPGAAALLHQHLRARPLPSPARRARGCTADGLLPAADAGHSVPRSRTFSVCSCVQRGVRWGFL